MIFTADRNVFKNKSELQDFSFDQEEPAAENSGESNIIEILTTGDGLPMFVISHVNGIDIYTCMQVLKLQQQKEDKDIFSCRIRCLNQSSSDKCSADFTIYSTDSSVFEFSKRGRAK